MSTEWKWTWRKPKPAQSITIEDLIEEARQYESTPEERREFIISFAYGNCAIGNPKITREMVERAYEELYGNPKSNGV